MNNNFLKRIVSFSDNQWHRGIYKYVSYVSVLLIVIAYTGIAYINPIYISAFHSFILYYISIILLIRFNPYIKYSNSKSPGHSEFDRKIAFTAGIILFTTSLSHTILTYILKNSDVINTTNEIIQNIAII